MNSPSILAKDPSHRLRRVTVLIVDNDPAISKLMSDVLHKLGFGPAYVASDGFEAIEMLRHHKIDLMITDWDLKAINHENDDLPPNSVIAAGNWHPCAPTNGSLFLKFLRASKHSPNPYLAVIMMTGVALQKNIAYARDSGVNEVIVKPVTAESLCRHIRMVVENHRPFITAQTYRGPCRRRGRKNTTPTKERRIADIKIIKFKG